MQKELTRRDNNFLRGEDCRDSRAQRHHENSTPRPAASLLETGVFLKIKESCLCAVIKRRPYDLNSAAAYATGACSGHHSPVGHYSVAALVATRLFGIPYGLCGNSRNVRKRRTNRLRYSHSHTAVPPQTPECCYTACLGA